MNNINLSLVKLFDGEELIMNDGTVYVAEQSTHGFINFHKYSDEEVESISVERLEEFNWFYGYATCEYCNGVKFYHVLECDKRASECCGGCTVPIECECPNVKFIK